MASGETLYCRTMFKRPFDAVLARLERDRCRGIEPPRWLAASEHTEAMP